jgi:hypothetical protein
MTGEQQILWTTPDRARFFLVPENLELLTGDFLIRTPTERRASVDEAGIRVFEVSEEDAKAWAKAQLGGMLDDVRGAIDRFTDTLHRKAREL